MSLLGYAVPDPFYFLLVVVSVTAGVGELSVAVCLVGFLDEKFCGSM